MSNKPKVQTRTYIAKKREEAIMNILKGSIFGISPKIIAYKSKRTNYPIKHNTAKSILKRLESNGKVSKKIRGYYVLVDNGTHDIFSYNLHNIVLTYSFDELDIDSKINETINAYLGKITFGIGAKSKKATMCISTDYPFSFASIGLLAVHFEDKIMKHCGIKICADDIIIRSIEFNKDYKGLKLEGINSLTLSNCVSNFKIYQKNDRVRKEYRINEPVSMNLLLGILGGNLNTFNYAPEIIAMKEQFDGLNKKFAYMFKLLEKTKPRPEENKTQDNINERYGWFASKNTLKEKRIGDSELEITGMPELYCEEYGLL